MKRSVLPSLLFFVSFTLFFSLSYHFKVFRYQTFSCTLQGETCSEPIMAELNRLTGTWFFSKKLPETIKKIQKSNPEISQVHIKKQFPHKLVIQMTKKSLVLNIVCPTFTLGVSEDQHMQELIQTQSKELPSISASIEVCERLHSQNTFDQITLSQLLLLLQKLHDEYSDHQLEWSTDHTLVLKTPKNQRIFFSMDGVSSQLQSYQVLISQSALPEGWNSLDLRFQKAIVRKQ